VTIPGKIDQASSARLQLLVSLVRSALRGEIEIRSQGCAFAVLKCGSNRKSDFFAVQRRDFCESECNLQEDRMPFRAAVEQMSKVPVDSVFEN
jgi:hypothetical protein